MLCSACKLPLEGHWSRCENLKDYSRQIVLNIEKDFKTVQVSEFFGLDCKNKKYVSYAIESQYELKGNEGSSVVSRFFFHVPNKISAEVANEKRFCGFDDWKEEDWRQCSYLPEDSIGEIQKWKYEIVDDELVIDLDIDMDNKKRKYIREEYYARKMSY